MLPHPAPCADRAAWLRRWWTRGVAAGGHVTPRCDRATAAPRCRPSAAAASSGSTRVTRQPCHFDALGLRRGATRDEVKAAFRRLARQWHPDVNASPEAAARFQELCRAFEVLSDDRKRHAYERQRFGSKDSSGSSDGGAGGRGSRPRGSDAEPVPPAVRAVLQLSFREAALGTQRSVELAVTDACTLCHGTGGQPGTPCPPCGMCKGRGEILRLRAPSQPGSVACCPVCAGRGFAPRQPCSRCGGEGMAARARRVAVLVPAGVEDGARLRLAGEGSVARVGGPRGFADLEVQVGREEGMWRRGLDLHSQLSVPLWDALLGGTATVATLHGTAPLAIPPGTQHGAVLTLPAAGVRREAACGAHHFEVRVALPRQVSSDEQRLLQRLAELQGGGGLARG